MAQHQQELHPIFFDIERGDLAAVQQRVLADAAVLEERYGFRWTPLIYAICDKEPAMALWLVEHRGQHDLNATDGSGWTALHWASHYGPLEVVHALVAAGANPAAVTGEGRTPLLIASIDGHTDTVAFLLQLPAVKATIDAIDRNQDTALSNAFFSGRQPIVQLLLDAGAETTLPAGEDSPLSWALGDDTSPVAALLRQASAEADRGRALHKARSLLGAGAAAHSVDRRSPTKETVGSGS